MGKKRGGATATGGKKLYQLAATKKGISQEKKERGKGKKKIAKPKVLQLNRGLKSAVEDVVRQLSNSPQQTFTLAQVRQAYQVRSEKNDATEIALITPMFLHSIHGVYSDKKTRKFFYYPKALENGLFLKQCAEVVEGIEENPFSLKQFRKCFKKAFSYSQLAWREDAKGVLSSVPGLEKISDKQYRRVERSSDEVVVISGTEGGEEFGEGGENEARGKVTPEESEDEEEDRRSDSDGEDEKEEAPDSTVERLLFTCPIRDCPSSYNSFEELQKHVEEHSDEENYACDVCKKEFSKLKKAMKHIRKRKERECCQCGKKTDRPAILISHHRVHTGERPFTCGHCKKTFTERSALNRHELTHSGEKPHECDECGKKFKTSWDLTVHLRTHTGDKPYECGHCEKRFTQMSNMKKHVRIHTGVQPFKCYECGRRFSDKSAFNRHAIKHTGVPYSCEKCDKQYNSKTGLWTHMKKSHK